MWLLNLRYDTIRDAILTCGMTKYRKGPQRTAKDHKRPTKDRKGALRAKLQEIDTN